MRAASKKQKLKSSQIQRTQWWMPEAGVTGWAKGGEEGEEGEEEEREGNRRRGVVGEGGGDWEEGEKKMKKKKGKEEEREALFLAACKAPGVGHSLFRSHPTRDTSACHRFESCST